MRIYTYSHGYSTTSRGSRQWTLGICASFFLLMLGIPSTSDAATLTYDFDVSGDDGASIDGWTDVFSRAPSFPSGTVWGSVTGGRATGGFARWPEHTSGSQDSAHPNHIMRSPEFFLTASSSIDFQIGGGWGTANTYTKSADIDPNGNSNSSGQQKFYLRRVSDDTYLLNRSRNTNDNGNNWRSFTWDSATIATAISGDAASETYTVEWVDTYSGGWGFGMIDDVVLNNVTLVPEPSSLALVGLGSMLVMRRRRRH